MLFISYGMEKSASSFVFRITQEIAEAAGHSQRRLRTRYLPEEWRSPWGKIIDQNTEPEKGGGPVLPIDAIDELIPDEAILVIKTHSAPPAGMAAMLKAGHARASATCRDPRDVAVSMLDAGEKNRRPESKRSDFTHIHTMEQAIKAARWDMVRFQTWMEMENTLRLPFPFIKGQPYEVGRRIAAHMALQVAPDPIVASFLDGDIPNYNVGLEGRFKDAMSPAQLAMAEELFGGFRG